MIATVVGGEWPERLKQAVEAMLIHAAGDPQSLGIMVLEDIRALFHERGKWAADHRCPEALSSDDIVRELLKLEDRPWGALGKAEKALTKNRLARLLGPYGIKPASVRIGDDIPRGYKREQFIDAWKRYLRPFDPSDQTTSARGDTEHPQPYDKSEAIL